MASASNNASNQDCQCARQRERNHYMPKFVSKGCEVSQFTVGSERPTLYGSRG